MRVQKLIRERVGMWKSWVSVHKLGANQSDKGFL